mmetsp:Transcript_5068/g.13251  ORF Transcript_5068/g.13251 Transcript_5068/m.13251 type:complete len:146 (+) Transcript_5068:298-735(+)
MSDEGSKEKGRAATDAVTKLQSEVANLSYLYYNFTGALQEAAPPISIKDEPVSVESATSVEYQPEELAKQIVDGHRKVEKLIQELPDFNLDEDEQFETILQTQDRTAEAREAFRSEVRNADRLMDCFQDCYSVLADYQLSHGKFK